MCTETRQQHNSIIRYERQKNRATLFRIALGSARTLSMVSENYFDTPTDAARAAWVVQQCINAGASPHNIMELKTSGVLGVTWVTKRQKVHKGRRAKAQKGHKCKSAKGPKNKTVHKGLSAKGQKG